MPWYIVYPYAFLMAFAATSACLLRNFWRRLLNIPMLSICFRPNSITLSRSQTRFPTRFMTSFAGLRPARDQLATFFGRKQVADRFEPGRRPVCSWLSSSFRPAWDTHTTHTRRSASRLATGLRLDSVMEFGLFLTLNVLILVNILIRPLLCFVSLGPLHSFLYFVYHCMLRACVWL